VDVIVKTVNQGKLDALRADVVVVLQLHCPTPLNFREKYRRGGKS
jgi:hypothetical protein